MSLLFQVHAQMQESLGNLTILIVIIVDQEQGHSALVLSEPTQNSQFEKKKLIKKSAMIFAFLKWE